MTAVIVSEHSNVYGSLLTSQQPLVRVLFVLRGLTAVSTCFLARRRVPSLELFSDQVAPLVPPDLAQSWMGTVRQYSRPAPMNAHSKIPAIHITPLALKLKLPSLFSKAFLLALYLSRFHMVFFLQLFHTAQYRARCRANLLNTFFQVLSRHMINRSLSWPGRLPHRVFLHTLLYSLVELLSSCAQLAEVSIMGSFLRLLSLQLTLRLLHSRNNI